MKLAAGAWLSSIMLTVLALVPTSSIAGMSQEEVKSFEGYRVKAMQGDPLYQAKLAGCYSDSKGVAWDMEQAVLWLRKAAEQGHTPSQYNLAFVFYAGVGLYTTEGQPDIGPRYVKQNRGEAVKWFRKAADGGHASSQAYLGRCYEIGQGVTKDQGEAIKWWHKAAEQGNAMALNCIGACYDNGDGVAKDEVEAYAYFNLAGITDEDARKQRDKVGERLSPEARLRGQQRTKELRKEIEAKIAAKASGK